MQDSNEVERLLSEQVAPLKERINHLQEKDKNNEERIQQLLQEVESLKDMFKNLRANDDKKDTKGTKSFNNTAKPAGKAPDHKENKCYQTKHITRIIDREWKARATSNSSHKTGPNQKASKKISRPHWCWQPIQHQGRNNQFQILDQGCPTSR